MAWSLLSRYMEFDQTLHDPRSRRAFLRTAGAGLAGSGLLLAGCGGSSSKQQAIASQTIEIREFDAQILNGVLDVEHNAVAAYTAGIPLLSGPARVAATRFLAQEVSHVTALSGAIKGAGGKPNAPRARYDLGNPRRPADVLAMLSTIEASLVDVYLDAIPKLTPVFGLRGDVAGILANEGQHISVLRSIRGEPPVPSAFVTANE